MSARPGGRILFAAVHPPNRVPSQRFRFEQYVPYLAEHGMPTTFAPLIRPGEYGVMYGDKHLARKAWIGARGVGQRARDLLRLRHFDFVVVQREAIQLGTALFERAVARARPRLIFDFDDAIWLQHASVPNRRLAWLKNPAKTAQLISMADLVLAGNAYLADYARGFNRAVEVVPTTIDTDGYVRDGEARDGGPICIGWSGSLTTMEHFKLMVPVLRRMKERYGDDVRFKLIGDGRYRNDELGLQGQDWSAATEVRDLLEFDIGVMPLPDDKWSRGKCGLKGLQYMALEIPTVMSPVGVNTDIIDDGRNGLLAAGEDEWVSKLSELVESAELRRRLGREARQTVEEHYSVRSQRDRYVSLLRGLG
jgi:glycosyltransferase involved in cell wall biosynthesis